MNFNAIDLEGIRSMLIELLLKENSSTAVNLWFGDLKLASIDENEAVFVSPTDLKKKIIQQRFAISMADHLNEILGFEPSVVIHSSEHGEIDLSKEKLETFEKIEKGDILPSGAKNIEMPPNYRSEYTFENFVVGVSNKFANSAAVAVSPAIS